MFLWPRLLRLFIQYAPKNNVTAGAAREGRRGEGGSSYPVASETEGERERGGEKNLHRENYY